ncbi:hypothetical protein ER57_03210 [Smithella sp. SCADC]|jgi:hypothetical protein|nr:hypothetical protein ER57_03210 [Smithella sp. SCADC]
MAQYKLKDGVQGFTVIDGEMAGKSFKSGIAYDAIPSQEAAKFYVIPEAAVDAPADIDGQKKRTSK